jgi:nitrate reductase gamma subunit
MAMGLLRILVLDIWAAIEAYKRAGDKNVPWNQAFRKTIAWLFPVSKVLNSRPAYSLLSIFFHIGLIIIPIFLYAHVQLWKGGIGFGWFTLPKLWADYLTLGTIIFGLALFIGRIVNRASLYISRKQDFLWPLLLIIPFITGYLCANLNLMPKYYDVFMLMHILSGDLIFILMPFTKIAHCVIMPLSQFILALAWRFPPNTDEPICATLNKKGTPV